MDRIAGSFSRQVQTSPIIDLCAAESNPDLLKVPRNFEVFRTTAAKSEGAYFPAVGSAIRKSALNFCTKSIGFHPRSLKSISIQLKDVKVCIFKPRTSKMFSIVF